MAGDVHMCVQEEMMGGKVEVLSYGCEGDGANLEAFVLTVMADKEISSGPGACTRVGVVIDGAHHVVEHENRQ